MDTPEEQIQVTVGNYQRKMPLPRHQGLSGGLELTVRNEDTAKSAPPQLWQVSADGDRELMSHSCLVKVLQAHHMFFKPAFSQKFPSPSPRVPVLQIQGKQESWA